MTASQAPDTSPAPAEGASGTEVVKRVARAIAEVQGRSRLSQADQILARAAIAALAHPASDREANKHSDVSLTDKSPECTNNTAACGAQLVASDRVAEITYEVWQGDMMVAASDSEEDARHYLMMYAQDGPAKMMRAETTRALLVEMGEKL